MGSNVFESFEFITCILNFSNSTLWQNWMNSFIISEHRVEVWYIKSILRQLWFEFRNNLFIEKCFLIYAGIPRMAKNFIYTSLWSKSIFWVLHEALADEIFTLVWHCNSMLLSIWEEYWLCLDQIVHFLVIWASCVERWESDDHFVS